MIWKPLNQAVHGRALTRCISTAFLACLLGLAASTAWALPDRYTQLSRDLRSLQRSPYAKVVKIGRSVKGRPIYSVVLTAPKGSIPLDQRTRVVLMCGQHGDEPASILSMLPLIHELSQTIDSHHRALLSRAVIIWIPVVNPDGFVRSTRTNANGADLNRDWEDLTQPETIAVSGLISSFRPQVIVDEHEWSVDQPKMTNCVEVASSGPKSTIKLSYLLAHTAAENMPRGGLAFQRICCQADRDPRLAHRHFANEGICSMLMETSPRSPMGSRLNWYRNFVISLLDSVAYPPDGVIANDLHDAIRSSGRPQFSVASLYATGTDTGSFLYWFAASMLAACIVCKCAGIGGTNACANGPELAGRESRRRRLTVADAVRLDSPTRVKLRILKENRFRPTDRTTCRQNAPVRMQV